jgi:hypothetical protein
MYFAFLKEFELILLQEQLNFGAATKSGALGIAGDGEGTASGRAPNVLLIVVVLGHNLDSLRNEVCAVETNTELT